MVVIRNQCLSCSITAQQRALKTLGNGHPNRSVTGIESNVLQSRHQTVIDPCTFEDTQRSGDEGEIGRDVEGNLESGPTQVPG